MLLLDQKTYRMPFCDHSFCVSVGTAVSVSVEQEEGVPQRSILNVTLFAVAINVIALSLLDGVSTVSKCMSTTWQCGLLLLVYQWRRGAILLRLYCSLFWSKLEYGCEGYSSTTAARLRIRNTVYHDEVHLVTGAFRSSQITNPWWRPMNHLWISIASL